MFPVKAVNRRGRRLISDTNNTTERSRSWQTNSSSHPVKKISRILWNPPRFVTELTTARHLPLYQINLFHALSTYFCNTQFDITLLPTYRSNALKHPNPNGEGIRQATRH